MRCKISFKMLSTISSCVTLDFSEIMSFNDSPLGVILPLWAYLAMPGGICVCHSWGDDTASSRQRPGVLLNILLCTGQPHNKELSDPKCQSGGVEKL